MIDHELLQRRIGFLVAGVCLLIFCFHITKGLLVYGFSIGESLAVVPNLTLILASLLFLLTAFFHGSGWRLLQCTVILIVATLSILDDHDSFYGVGLFLMALILGYRYGFLDRLRKVKLGSLALLYIALVEISIKSSDPEKAAISFDSLLYLLVYFAFLWFTFEAQIRKLLLENTTLESKIFEDRPYTEMGVNLSGFVHNLKNDVMAIHSAVKLYEMGVVLTLEPTHEALGRMHDRISATTCMIGERKRAGMVIHNGSALLTGICELFQCITEYYSCAAIDLDTPEYLPVFGEGEQIAQAIENILKNSFEAVRETGAYGTIVVRGYEGQAHSSIRIANTAGPMEICAGCPGTGCLRCDRIGEGKSTKLSGSGIGLSYVKRVLQACGGDLRIHSNPLGVETELVFRKV